jgi:hypothetical protein
MEFPPHSPVQGYLTRGATLEGGKGPHRCGSQTRRKPERAPRPIAAGLRGVDADKRIYGRHLTEDMKG